MNILAALAGLKTASELTTRIREALKSREVKLDEVVARIIEIQDLISDGRTALIDSQEELMKKNEKISSLSDEIRSLKAKADLEHLVVFHDRACWKKLDDGSEEGPYCPVCWGDSKKLIRGSVWDTLATQISFCCNLHPTAVRYTVPRQIAKGY
jgi:hypothetical protein